MDSKNFAREVLRNKSKYESDLVKLAKDTL